MADFLGSQCDYCRLSITLGQRWAREKIYDPSFNSRDSSYRCYHAEPFEGQDRSCWERHEMQREMFRTAGQAA